MQPVIHFELPYEDGKRAGQFYTQAFGWQAQTMGDDMGNYVVVTTIESDQKTGRPTKPGAINGGLFKRTKPEQAPSVVIGVDDIQEAMKKIEAAGGKVIGGMQKPGEPDNIPGVGLYIAFTDTEGNRIGVLQPAAPAAS